MKKIFILSLFLFIFLLGSVSAALWDDIVLYYDYNSTTDLVTGVYNLVVQEGAGASFTTTNALLGKSGNYTLNNNFNISANQGTDIGTHNTTVNWWVRYDNSTSPGSEYMWIYNTSECIITRYPLDELYVAGSGTIAGTNLSKDNWHMVTLIHNGTDLSAYIDSVLVDVQTYAGSGCGTGNRLVNLGTNQAGSQDMANGMMDEMGWWNRTLSSVELTELYNGGGGLRYGGVGPQIVTVTLNTPLNATQTNADPVNFNVTLTPSTYNLTNATFYIWYDNGTLFNTSTNSLSENISVTSAWNVYSFIIDSYVWNVLGVQGDGVGVNSSFADSNFTLHWIPFNVENESFNTETLETQNEIIYLNITTDEDVTNLGAFLIYNGTYYAADHSCSEGLCQIERELDIPLLINQANSYENKSFHWQITLFGDFGTFTTNTSANEQNVSNIDFSTTALYKTVQYEIFNESSLNRVITNFDATFTYYLGTGTVNEEKNYSLSGGHTYNLSIDQNETFKVNATIKLTTNGTNTREYFFLKEEFTNVTTTQELFVPHTDISNIIIELRNQGLIPLGGYLIKMFRFYPDLNDEKLIGSQLTDELGQTVGKLVQNNEKYKFEFYNQNKVLLKTSDKMTVACRSSFCILPFVIETADDVFERYENLTLFSYNFEFNNETNTFTILWDDQRQETSTMRLEVVRFQFNQSSVVCDTSSTTKVSSMSCAVGSQKASYKGQVFRVVEGSEERRIAIITVSVGNPYSTFGVEGLLWVFILLLTGIGVGAFNPVVGASIYGSGFLIFGLIGLISMPIPVFFANTLLVVLFIWAVRT